MAFYTKEVRNKLMSEAEIDSQFDYHAPSTGDIVDAHEVTRALFKGIAKAYNDALPDAAGRELAILVTKLEEAMFWANAAIARHQDSDPSIYLDLHYFVEGLSG